MLLLNTNTNTLHESRLADERCNLDDAKRVGNLSKKVYMNDDTDNDLYDLMSKGYDLCKHCFSDET